MRYSISAVIRPPALSLIFYRILSVRDREQWFKKHLLRGAERIITEWKFHEICITLSACSSRSHHAISIIKTACGIYIARAKYKRDSCRRLVWTNVSNDASILLGKANALGNLGATNYQARRLMRAIFSQRFLLFRLSCHRLKEIWIVLVERFNLDQLTLFYDRKLELFFIILFSPMIAMQLSSVLISSHNI